MKNFSAATFKSTHLGVLLGQTAALKDRILERHLQPLGITAAQLKVLRLVVDGENTAGALCRNLSIDSAAMTRMLNRLERKKLIRRARDCRDQRQIRLALTEYGQAVGRQIPLLAGVAMQEFAGGLSADELLSLEALLEKTLSPQRSSGATLCDASPGGMMKG